MTRTIAQRTALIAATFAALLSTIRLPASDVNAEAGLRERSHGWYVLAQPDGDDLLHGLPQRLGLAAASDRVNAAGEEADVTATVTVQYDGALEGDLFLGLFADARFAAAPPVAVYRLSGPGEHEIRLPEGEWSIGAMVGLPPHPEASLDQLERVGSAPCTNCGYWSIDCKYLAGNPPECDGPAPLAITSCWRDKIEDTPNSSWCIDTDCPVYATKYNLTDGCTPTY